MTQGGTRLEVRLAPVMTGGTSLAVWMGGVTSELFALLHANPDPGTGVDDADPKSVYNRVLTATHTTAVVDVVTGTSAGGLNGMLLAVAVHLGLPLEEFGKLRDTWMDDGDLANLLRSPGESDPPSLLRGDEYFQERIEKVLEQWWSARITPESDAGGQADDDCQVDLLTTYTRVKPVPVARIDDFDERLNEVSYAGTLRFNHEQLNGKEGDNGQLVRRKLAIAARTSAGIPGVFEPSFLASNSDDATASGRPDFSEHQPPEVRGMSRWAVDGGVVVNLPLRYVVDRIFGQRSHGRVRRVVLYVSPTPSDALPRKPEKSERRPKIAASTITVVNAPRAEGIATDVDAIRRSNAAVEHQRQARRTIGLLLDTVDNTQLTSENTLLGELYKAYKVTRSRSSVDQVITMLRPRFHDDERFVEDQFRAVLGQKRPALLPNTIDKIEGGNGQPWGWGIAPIEQTASAVLGLINQALQMLDAQRTPEQTAASAGQLGEYKRQVHTQLAKVAELRRRDDEFWIEFIESINIEAGDDPEAKTKARCCRYAEAYDEWPVVGSTSADATQGRDVLAELRSAHREIVRALLEATPLLEELAPENPAEVEGADSEAMSVPGDAAGGGATPSPAEFAAELNACVGPAADGGSVATTEIDEARLDEVEQRMLRFHVIATQTIGGLRSREQLVELMQVSSNVRNELGPKRTSAQKLVGPELGRLGAFLKESWRANDWFWGRMDGAARLCHLLVDPRRIWERYGSDDAEAAVSAFGIEPGHPKYETITAEMTQLLESGDPSGCELPTLVGVLTRERQLAVARDEIPKIRAAIERSELAGGNESRSREFVEAAKAPGALDTDAGVVEVLEKLRIGEETAKTELGSRLMVRNLTRAATVATNAATGSESGLKAVGAPFRALRAPLRLLSAVIGTLAGASPLARGLTAMILAGAGAIVALRLAGVEVNGVLSGAATTLFVGALVVALFRLGVGRFAVLFALLATVYTLATVGGDLRDVLYDEVQVVRVEVGPAVTITFGAETTVEVRDPGSPLTGCEPEVDDAAASEATSICGFVQGGSKEVPVDEALLTALLVDATVVATGTEKFSPWWKEIFLANWWFASPFTWFAFAVALFALARALRVHWRTADGRTKLRRTDQQPIGRRVISAVWSARWWLLMVAAVGLGVANERFAETLLTGRETGDDTKASVVRFAESLADHRLVVLLVVLIVLGTVIGLGTSGVSRAWHRFKTRVARWRRQRKERQQKERQQKERRPKPG